MKADIKLICSQLWCEILPLRLEQALEKGDTTGQTRSPKLEERGCSICLRWEVEDEYNFLFRCNDFAYIWAAYIKNIMRNSAHFINLTLEETITFLITKFLRDVKRKKFSYS